MAAILLSSLSVLGLTAGDVRLVPRNILHCAPFGPFLVGPLPLPALALVGVRGTPTSTLSTPSGSSLPCFDALVGIQGSGSPKLRFSSRSSCSILYTGSILNVGSTVISGGACGSSSFRCKARDMIAPHLAHVLALGRDRITRHFANALALLARDVTIRHFANAASRLAASASTFSFLATFDTNEAARKACSSATF